MSDENKQGEPVALPKHRYDDAESCNPVTQRRAEGWNACLDEIAKLGPLYTHADTGDAGRLRALLAERDALLNTSFRELHLARNLLLRLSRSGVDVSAVIDGSWPSAPVERDERAEFEIAWRRTPVLRENKRTIAEKFWRARADLERKK